MNYPRVMLAAAASGSGKTLLTCGLLQILKNRGLTVSSFKCGPDYIDPMFHGRVLHAESANLDTWFTDGETTRYLFSETAKKSDISIMEGVMGFYDGLGGLDTKASAYDLAKVTDTPVILIVNAKGMSLSVLAQVKGFMEYRKDSHIRGVIFNQMSAGLYSQLKEKLETELGISCLGYVPVMKGWHLESRHLGLVLPDEVADLEAHMQEMANTMEETLDVEGIIHLAESALAISCEIPEKLGRLFEDIAVKKLREQKPVIAVAKDEAFCFIYRDNIKLLEKMGARIAYFSPIHDGEIPKEAKGVILFGGYPELFAKELSENTKMLQCIRRRVADGMPYLAECGGFMYLHEDMEDMEGNFFRVCGIQKGNVFKTSRLQRFGYIELKANKEEVLGTSAGAIRGHEFHYFDSTENGVDFHATKPVGKRSWDCIVGSDRSLMGFPHLYYYSNPVYVLEFLEKCCEWEGQRKWD